MRDKHGGSAMGTWVLTRTKTRWQRTEKTLQDMWRGVGSCVCEILMKRPSSKGELPHHRRCCCLYLLRREAECWRLDSGSQVFSADEYPFHAVRYN